MHTGRISYRSFCIELPQQTTIGSSVLQPVECRVQFVRCPRQGCSMRLKPALVGCKLLFLGSEHARDFRWLRAAEATAGANHVLRRQGFPEAGFGERKGSLFTK